MARLDFVRQGVLLRRRGLSPGRVRSPGVLNGETKLLTDAIRMSAYNAESTLARLLAGHYARADHEARSLIREAFTFPGDLHVADG